MKRFFLIILILLLCIGTWLYYKWKNPIANSDFKIPDNCNIYAVVNTHELIELYLKNKDSFGNEKNPILEEIKENAAIDFLKPAWVFSCNNFSVNGVAFISTNIDSTKKSLLKSGFVFNQEYYALNQFIVQQLGNYFYFSNGVLQFTKQTKLEPKLLQNLSGKLALFNFQMPQSWPTLKNQWITGGISFSTSTMTVNFEKNIAENNEIDSTAIASINAPNFLIEKELKKFLYKNEIDTTAIIDAKSNFIFQIIGKGQKAEKIITYVMDDEFNQKEIVTNIYKPFLECYFNCGNGGNQWYTNTKSDSLNKNEKVKNIFGIPISIQSGPGKTVLYSAQKKLGKIPGILNIKPKKLFQLSKVLQIPVSLKSLIYFNNISILNSPNTTININTDKDKNTLILMYYLFKELN